MSRTPRVRLRAIFVRTSGHCHFCGDELRFGRYGRQGGTSAGAWVIDHVIQRHRGGMDDLANYLPICPKCNHLRWHRRGENLRDLLELGLVAKDEVKRRTALGDQLTARLTRRRAQNQRRRTGRS